MRTARRKGAALIFVLFIIMVVLAIAPLMVDLGYRFASKSRVQSAADAASLAGALRLRDEKANLGDVQKMAIDFAELNQKDEGKVLQHSDIDVGEWNTDTHTFVKGGPNMNAVRVTVRRGGKHSNSVPTFFAKIFGAQLEALEVISVSSFDVSEDDGGNDEKGMPFLVE